MQTFRFRLIGLLLFIILLGGYFLATQSDNPRVYNDKLYAYQFTYPKGFKLRVNPIINKKGREVGIYFPDEKGGGWVGTISSYDSVRELDTVDDKPRDTLTSYLKNNEFILASEPFSNLHAKGYKTNQQSFFDGSDYSGYYFENKGKVYTLFFSASPLNPESDLILQSFKLL